ncbi:MULTISPECIES: hypothetical protein [unclassified Nitrosomonas]|jgi:hypothetical protein|uniref:hypothetical protein n=1 Tax=unclassified Nitrosomonas TaxID=2609265 RepID=UPI001DB776BD|nr:MULTISPECIES: hypothetical protein [unclassified Nitrosomonas]MBX9896178.1 hypothetical protein [Nitrosomonas sp.]WMJ08875.1 hypothetical protein RBH92_01330 [Nitrosomonas sp. sh817]
MKITYLLAVSAVLVLVACGGKPTAPESPDPDAYGKTIQPFHQIPAGDQEGGGKARSTEDKSNY